MSGIDCAREQEVVAAVLGRRWPDGCADELRVHAEACEVCADVVVIASLLREDQSRGARRGRAGRRTGLVARRHPCQGRSGAGGGPADDLAAGLAGACFAGLGLALLSLAWPSIHNLVANMFAGAAPLLVGSLRGQLGLTVTVGVVLLVAPIAFYVAVVRE